MSLADALIARAQAGGGDVSDVIRALAESRQRRHALQPIAPVDQPPTRTQQDFPTMPYKAGGAKFVLPTQWKGTHETDGLGWGTKSAVDLFPEGGGELLCLVDAPPAATSPDERSRRHHPGRVATAWTALLGADVRLRAMTAIVLALTLTGVAVFWGFSGLGLDLVDAIYFTVTIITTTGFGDINLREAPPALQLYGVTLMLSGTAALAICSRSSPTPWSAPGWPGSWARASRAGSTATWSCAALATSATGWSSSSTSSASRWSRPSSTRAIATCRRCAALACPCWWPTSAFRRPSRP